MTKKPVALGSHTMDEGETDPALLIPAVYVNSFRLRVGLDVTRLSFAEVDATGGEPHYRLAMIMPSGEAMNLANTLRSLADKLQAQVSAITSAGMHGEKPN